MCVVKLDEFLGNLLSETVRRDKPKRVKSKRETEESKQKRRNRNVALSPHREPGNKVCPSLRECQVT